MMRDLLIGASVVTLCACSGRASSPQPTEPEAAVAPAAPVAAPAATPGVSWGQPGQTVADQAPVTLRSRVRLAAQPDNDEPAFEVGSPLLLAYQIQNTGAAPLSIWHAGFWPNHRIRVRDASGVEPPLTDFGRTVVAAFSPRGPRDKNVEWPLAPGAIDSSEGGYDLTKLYQLSEPGAYTVEVDYQEEVLVRSNRLRFWLLPVGAAEPLSRLDSWDKEECDVAERPAAYPGRVASGETNGYLETQKQALAALGVEVVWDPGSRRYRVKAVAPVN